GSPDLAIRRQAAVIEIGAAGSRSQGGETGGAGGSEVRGPGGESGGLGALLWEWRHRRGLSLGQLARAAGVHKATLSRWEAGARQPRVPELEAALRALDVSATEAALAFA